jgi:hypothetical protein
MTKLRRPCTRAVDGPTIQAKLRRPLVVTITPQGQLILRPQRYRSASSVVTYDLFALYFRGLMGGT